MPTSAPISVWYAPRCLTEGKDLIDLFTMTLLEGVFLEPSLPCVMRKKARVYGGGPASEIHRVLPWPKISPFVDLALLIIKM